MKKLAICCLVLAVAAVFVPTSQAGVRCISFTNFCDQIEYNTSSVGHETGNLLYGNWDWLCNFENSATVIGKAGAKLGAATRPYSAVYNYLFAYSMGFTFVKTTHLFDLYGTSGGITNSPLTFQQDQPWTQATGSCGFAKRAGLPRLTAR